MLSQRIRKVEVGIKTILTKVVLVIDIGVVEGMTLQRNKEIGTEMSIMIVRRGIRKRRIRKKSKIKEIKIRRKRKIRIVTRNIRKRKLKVWRSSWSRQR